MKLKVLPPTLRKNNHYLVLDIFSQVEINKNDFVNICWDGCVKYFGECHTSDFNLWVMRFQEVNCKSDHFCYQAVVRCQRGYEEDLRVALACVNQYKNHRISILTIGMSGTIKAAVDKYFD